MRRRQKVFEAVIYLKSGQSFVFDTVTLTTERAPGSGELTGIKWETPADTWFRKYRRLAYVRLTDVLAVVAHQGPKPRQQEHEDEHRRKY